ncbi:hypothetical protein F5141DRAFT_1014638 [Pisolithus sp. B1]|nr:hypothetical protein F5141DRAFT_1014638 [Pisolithus sp. B1]
MENPNLAICLDFSTDEFLEAHLHLLNDAVNDEQAMHTLETLWDINNAREERRRRATCSRSSREEETAQAEEHKKNKAKFAPTPDADVPSGPVNIPALYVTWKLKKGDYCELYFFTNNGLAEAESLDLSLDDEALTLLKADNGQHVWIPALTMRDKSAVIKDENLTWEQVGEATICLLNAMREHE